MPKSTYENLPDTVLDYKKKHLIGRFDPTMPEKQEQKVKEMWQEIQDGGKPSQRFMTTSGPMPAKPLFFGYALQQLTCGVGITTDVRCCLVNEPTRRGVIRFVGTISSLPGLHNAPWVGVALDEPFGKNDGSISGERYFDCDKNHGIFVRPERVEAGYFPELGLEEEDPDMEEI